LSFKWASRCLYEHGHPQLDTDSQLNAASLGQNLGMTKGSARLCACVFCVLIILHGSVVCTNNIDTELILIVNFYLKAH